MKSEVESYWERIAKAFGDNRTWYDLKPQEQQLVLQSINQMLAVLHRIV
jgi:hypothetical protein